MYEIVTPVGKEFNPPRGRSWQFSKERYEELVNDNRIWFGADGQNVPRIKKFLSEVKEGVIPKTLWLYGEVGSNDDAKRAIKDIVPEASFDSPKPVSLIEYIVRLSGNDGSIILDFFAGSGTTGQAVLELNKQDGGKRQFILATANEITDTTPNGIVNDVTSKRLKRVMTGECYDGTTDFKWNEKNQPLGDNLDVYDIATVANFENTDGKTPFDVIDETLYGQAKLGVSEKVKWVCENFENTQNVLTTDKDEK